MYLSEEVLNNSVFAVCYCAFQFEFWQHLGVDETFVALVHYPFSFVVYGVMALAVVNISRIIKCIILVLLLHSI